MRRSGTVVVIYLSLVGAVTLASCFHEKDPTLKREMSDVRDTIKRLEQRLIELQADVFVLKASSDRHKTVALDPSSPGPYQRIDSSSGIFLISVDDVKPYLDGQKLILQIGNPSSATYEGFTLEAQWGRRFDWNEMKSDPSAYNKWRESLQKKKTSFTQKLRPATWNRAELIVSPAKSDELGYVELSIDINKVILYHTKVMTDR